MSHFDLISLCLLSFLISLTPEMAKAQGGKIEGIVKIEGVPMDYVSVFIPELELGTNSDDKGYYTLENIPFGSYELTASFIGYKKISRTILLDALNPHLTVDFDLTETNIAIDEIVVTGTKTFKRQTNSPIIVNVLNSKALDNAQACNLSEGLKFQPGLRVETDCQTCNYTQLRMNGLAGGYAQILINGRPIFSPLTGLYGLEQLPVNMIQKIEVIRGGGSSLYGSSAVGGTINVLTKIPTSNAYELNYFYQNINGQSSDHNWSGNGSFVTKNKKSGLSLFFNHRNRDFYDHNADNFSELPLIKNTSVGANFFTRPTKNQKLEISLSNLNEYRFGGEMVDKPAHETQQSEERTHHVWMGSADYQINFKNEKSAFISYLAWQNTGREHYTGILPDTDEELEAHFNNPPYGTSNTITAQGGIQFNHRLDNFLSGTNVLTFGSELVFDDVFDEIGAYNYLIDQTTKDFGIFLQSDWELISDLTLLSGVRMDAHNLVKKAVFSPRASLLYKLKENTQFRLNYGTGFRAPQAFDTDLHIAFAGGGVSRVLLSPDLIPERSQSWSASINYDKPAENWVAGFTLESFYTRLKDAFYLNPIGEDEFGELFEKQNGAGATVKGFTLEARANFDRKAQIEAGFTIQSSTFDEAVAYIDGVPGIKDFIRTPSDYGFATLSFTPNKKININLNYVYTGSMIVPHFAGAPNQEFDEMINSKPFSELNSKFSYTFLTNKSRSNLELYGGVKNIFNAYQSSFDIGKNRDSNFVYGPSQPRTFFIGLKIKSAK